MSNYRKIFALTICVLILSCSCAYAADHFATTDMTWAEFYAGETNQTSSSLESEGLDAITSPTTFAISRFPLLLSASGDFGSIISGEKAVQVRMTDEVYEALSSEPRFTFAADGTTFSEYKDVNADGTFGKMVTQVTDASTTARVTIAGGASATWGNYQLSITNVSIDIGSANRYCDYYLGATIETSDGKIYGLRHDCNLWSDAGSIAFCVNANYVEPHGNGVVRDYDYTASLEGKTIKKITYMLKDRPDIVIDNLSLKVPSQTTVTVKTEEPAIGYLAESGVALKMTFSSETPAYTVKSVYMGSGRNRTNITDYTYTDGVLTLSGQVSAGSYTVMFESEGYVDISTSFRLYSTDATSLIISGDNAGDVNFLLTPVGAVSSVDAELEKGNFVNASEYTSPDLNHSVPLSGMPNEVEGSGFSFDIILNNVPSGKTAVVGFGKIFYLTPENCGEMYSDIYSAVDKMPAEASGFKHIEGDEFKTLGLRAVSIRNGEAVDVTSYVGAGAMISDDDHIMIYYGVMLADANTNEINEGAVYAFSPEGETLVSDGSRDGHLIAAWYFEKLETIESDAEVIEEKDNEAGINFSYTISATAEEKAEAAGLVWVSKEKGNLASGGKSDFVEGYTNQIAGNSGITFSIPVDKQKIPDGLSPMVRFESPFDFTAANIGTADYEKLRTSVAALSVPYASIWESAADDSGSLLKNANIHVIAVYPDETSRDITDLIQCGMKDNGNSITMNYGAIAVDRALTGSEGEKFDTGLEESPLMSDGLSDGNITVTWYLTHTSSDDGKKDDDKKDDTDPDPKPAAGFPGSPGGGCDALNLSSAVLLLGVAFTKLRRK